MTMRVFSPIEARNDQNIRLEHDARRAQSLAAITQEILEEKAKAEHSFDELMENQRREASEWHDIESSKKLELLREVEDLEERRKRALMPPLIKVEDIHSTEEALWARKLELDARETQVDDGARLLMRRLDEVSSQEEELNKREKRIKVLEKGVETQQKQIKNSARELNIRMEQFQQLSSSKETEFAYKDSELDAKEQLLNERESQFVAREDEIRASMRLLEDRRRLLDSGFEELNRLKEEYGSSTY